MEQPVAILIIIHQPEPTEAEQRALSRCAEVLGHYPIFFICPEGLAISRYRELIPAAQFQFIDPIWQSSYRMFNRLKIAPLLYETFSRYSFVLFYEPDSYVFRDELMEWIAKDYDYIGPPVPIDPAYMRLETAAAGFYMNGGFSLRKTASMLRVLHSWRKVLPQRYVNRWYNRFTLSGKIRQLPRYLMRSVGWWNNTHYRFNDYEKNEDLFWSFYVPRVIGWFNTPAFAEAARFGFDRDPEKLYRLTQQLPFGCHAWYKQHPEVYSHNCSFWKNHIHPFPDLG